MKLQLTSIPERLSKGVQVLAQYGFVEISETGISLNARQGRDIRIEKNDGKLVIHYDTEPHFYMALTRSLAMPDGIYSIEPSVSRFGFQIDCSRNAVPRVDFLKQLMCMLVMAGYDYFQLYMEDTYELPEEPYFGYKRGRYSVEELREVVDFAGILGIVIVPCIQTLAHLKNLTNWIKYYNHIDIDDVLLVDDERTYDLIRKMLSFWVDNFGLKRINIGLDEAFRLGRGKYVDTYGYRPKDEVYIRHMRRVFAICDELNVKPEFWADGFYQTNIPTEQIQELFNGAQTPVYWNYTSTDETHHEYIMEKLQKYSGKVNYAGGCIKWIGFAPNNGLSKRVMNAAFEAVKKLGVKDVLITTWGDNGDECSVYAVLPSIWHASFLAYPSVSDRNELLRRLTGYSEREWMLCDAMNSTAPQVDRIANAAKYMFYNDYLLGLMDANTTDNAGEIFADLHQKLKALAIRESPFSYIFKSYSALSCVLEKKATYGKRLYQAYQANDKTQLQALVLELDEISSRIYDFYQAFRDVWMTENKGYGFEVSDVRIGGMIYRAQSVKQTLEAYLKGDRIRIEELEEERLNYFGGQIEGEAVFAPLHNQWNTLFTINHF